MVDRITKSSIDRELGIEAVKEEDDNKQKQDQQHDEEQDQKKKKQKDAFDRQKKERSDLIKAQARISKTKAGLFGGQSRLASSGDIEMETQVASQKPESVIVEKSLSQTIKVMLHKTWMHTLGIKDLETNQKNTEVIIAYITAVTVLFAIVFGLIVLFF